MTMRANAGGSRHARSGRFAEPRGYSWMLVLLSVAASSMTANVILFVYLARGGVR